MDAELTILKSLELNILIHLLHLIQTWVRCAVWRYNTIATEVFVPLFQKGAGCGAAPHIIKPINQNLKFYLNAVHDVQIAEGGVGNGVLQGAGVALDVLTFGVAEP